MSERFAGLVKLPQQPARRILATAGVKIESKLESPASASVEVVLLELASKKAYTDMFMLLACALPPRERVWWACLAARDVVDPTEKPPLALSTSEAWVFKPTEENRIAAQKSIEVAEPMDETVHVATAVVFFDGTLGPGELAEHACPPGGAELSVFAMNVIAYCRDPDQMDLMADVLVDRALDIARGGSGNIPAPPMTPEEVEVEEEEPVFEEEEAVDDDEDEDEDEDEDDDAKKEPVT
jgi:hypothetical protein